ncbi:hypothetical protein FXV90_01110 [Staphylococcus pseudintermedius]|nr:hypothetical protein [Staphylococcus pseudintermedius]EHT7729667.1 hypothetical protein [Staphylococcus pseudintermedius]MBC8707795.1 hypothetical protein [Staphylococcus pseudintermedius]
MIKQIFNKKEIRFVEKDGEYWAIASDVAKILGFRDAFNATKNLPEDVMNETKDIYHYSIIDDKGEHKHTTDRKGHIIGIMEWALDYIVGNIEVEE